MNETTEKCSQARYARTISKVEIFLVKSDTVRLSIPYVESFGIMETTILQKKYCKKSWQTSDYELTHMKIWWQATHCITRQFKTIKGIKEKQTLQYNKQVSLLVKKTQSSFKNRFEFLLSKKSRAKIKLFKNLEEFCLLLQHTVTKVFFGLKIHLYPVSKKLTKM